MLFIVFTVFKHHKNTEYILSCTENCLKLYYRRKIGMKKNRFFFLLVWRTKHRIVGNWFIRCYLHKVTVININKSVYISTNMRLYDMRGRILFGSKWCMSFGENHSNWDIKWPVIPVNMIFSVVLTTGFRNRKDHKMIISHR